MNSQKKLTTLRRSKMKFFGRLISAAAVAAAVFSSPLMAQDWNHRPAFGTVNLHAGFTQDPWRRTVRAGGDFHNRRNCNGWFATAPDYRLQYTASSSWNLSIFVRASGDTVLLVNDPNGNWHCNDDFNGQNPGLTFAGPRSGQYDIWVGTWNRPRVRNAVIHVSELGLFNN
jgi:hypothetical protein